MEVWGDFASQTRSSFILHFDFAVFKNENENKLDTRIKVNFSTPILHQITFNCRHFLSCNFEMLEIKLDLYYVLPIL